MENSEIKVPKQNSKVKFKVYCIFRANGYNQKESARSAGVTEKTAKNYEIKRIKNINSEIAELDELINRLKLRSDNPSVSIRELLNLTSKIEDLNIKKRKLEAEI